MAITGFKTNANSLAKELNLKNKNILDLLAKGGFSEKGASASLTEDEYGYLMDLLTRENETTDLNSYLSGKTYVRVETEERIKQKKEADRLAAEKVAAEKAAAEKAAAEKAAAEKAAAEKAAAEKAEAEKAAAERAAKVAAQQARQKQNEPKDRFANPITFGKPAAKKEPEKKKVEKKPEQPAVTRKAPATENAPAVASNIFGHKAGVRVVDTRTTSVDLAKYDEKLEKYSSDVPYESQKQKLKKQNNRPGQQQGNKGGKPEASG